MIGNIEELTDYNNRKKDEYELLIPLNFWFCQDSGLALPIIAMIHNDIKIHVQFNDFNKLAKIVLLSCLPTKKPGAMSIVFKDVPVNVFDNS